MFVLRLDGYRWYSKMLTGKMQQVRCLENFNRSDIVRKLCNLIFLLLSVLEENADEVSSDL